MEKHIELIDQIADIEIRIRKMIYQGALLGHIKVDEIQELNKAADILNRAGKQIAEVAAKHPKGHRILNAIAREIEREWKNPYYGAVPYIQALKCVDTLNDMYGADNGRTLVVYFLGNAQTWRGEKARAIKKELNDILKNY